MMVSVSLVQVCLSLDLHFTSVPAGTGGDPYDRKLTKYWSTVVREIHDRIERNFLLIQHTVNVLIGLMTIVFSLLVGLVLGILVALFRVTRKFKLLIEGLAFLRATAAEGFTHRKNDPMQFAYSKKEGVLVYK